MVLSPPHYLTNNNRNLQNKTKNRQQQGGSLHLSLLIVFTANNSLESLDSCVSRRDDLSEIPERKSFNNIEYGISGRCKYDSSENVCQQKGLHEVNTMNISQSHPHSSLWLLYFENNRLSILVFYIP